MTETMTTRAELDAYVASVFAVPATEAAASDLAAEAECLCERLRAFAGANREALDGPKPVPPPPRPRW